MNEKICTKCKKSKPIDKYHFRNTIKNTRNSECKSCFSIRRKAYFQKNKKMEMEKTKARKKRVLKWFIDYKKTLKCEKCGETNIACLDFHHTNKEEKEGTMNRCIRNGWNIEKLKTEIEKCEILCSNCHREIHNNTRT